MLDEAAVGGLDGAFAGVLIGPGHREYESARRVWNGMVDRRPALIARCAHQGDVVAAVRFAREHGLALAVRGGGHNVAGNAVCDGGVVVDLSAQRAVEVDPDRAWPRVGPGALLGDVDRATQAFGLATPTGNVSLTGVAGLTLGGGLGWIARKHGPACDNLLSARGRHRRRRAGDGERRREPGPALGPARRRRELRDRDRAGVPPASGGPAGHRGRHGPRLRRCPRGPALLRRLRRHRAGRALGHRLDLPRPARLPRRPELHGELVTVLAVCYAGDLAAGERVLRPLRSFGRPLADLVAPMPYTALQSGSDAAYPSGQRNYWKSHFVGEISDAAIARSSSTRRA